MIGYMCIYKDFIAYMYLYIYMSRVHILVSEDPKGKRRSTSLGRSLAVPERREALQPERSQSAVPASMRQAPIARLDDIYDLL